MTETTIVEIATGVLGFLLTIIGYLLSSKDAAQERKIEELEKQVTALRIKVGV